MINLNYGRLIKMSKALLFPQYLPSALELRINLLLNERVSTIVPRVDQHAVMRRPQISGLYNYLPAGTFSFVDPTLAYSDKFDSRAMRGQLAKIIRPIARSPKHAVLWDGVDLDEFGKIPMQFRQATVDKLRKDGWVYLASQKIQRDLLDDLYSQKLAARVPSLHHEAHPTIIHPRVGGFILAQLARSIAGVEGARLIASDTPSLKDCLFESDQTARPSGEELMAVMLDVSMPDTIERVPDRDFMAARMEFRGVRENLNEIITSISSKYTLGDEKNIEEFKQFIKDKSSDINLAMSDAERAIGRDARAGKVSWGISLISSVVGAGLGAVMGQVPGAMIGAAVAPVVTGVGQRLSTSTIEQHNNGIMRLAALKASLNKRSDRAQLLRLI